MFNLKRLLGIFWYFALFCCAVTLSACTSVENAEVDQEVVYLEHDEIRFMMQKMAAMVFNLDKLVSESPNLEDYERQSAVIEQLGEIEKVAIKLGAGPKKTNHYVIDSGIDRLVEEVQVARNSAQSNPPHYDPAIGLIDQCRRCHIRR